MTDFDDQIQELCGRQEYDRATTLALEQLGPSIVRYLAARAGDHDLASEAFAVFSEDLWRGMSTFAGRSSLRIWAFAVARNALAQVLRRRGRERRHTEAFTTTLASRIAERVRTETLAYLRTETKERFLELRKSLSADEQTLLVLRVNERLSWDDIARIQLDGLDPASVKREAARFRKRFQLLREKLRNLAAAEGLLGGEGGDG